MSADENTYRAWFEGDPIAQNAIAQRQHAADHRPPDAPMPEVEILPELRTVQQFQRGDTTMVVLRNIGDDTPPMGPSASEPVRGATAVEGIDIAPPTITREESDERDAEGKPRLTRITIR